MISQGRYRVLCGFAAALLTIAASDVAAQSPTLGISLNQGTFTPGQTIDLGVSVTNPGGGPAADFFVLIQLPGSPTVLSIRLGASPVFGSLANLSSLVPAAARIGLGGPFAVSQPLFRYAFNGSEPQGQYLVYFAAVSSGAFGNGRLDGGELLALKTAAFTFGSGGILLPGAPGASALQTTSAYHASTGVPATAISTDGAGRRIARTQIEVKFRADATVAQVNAALTSVNGKIVSMLPGVLILLVEIPDPGSLAALDALTITLGQSPGVVSVIQQGFPDLAALPPNVAVTSADLDKIDHLLAARTHAAWNTEAALRRSSTVRPLLVLGDGFGLTQPGAPFDIDAVGSDYADTTYEQHGYHVLGTVAATFGGDITEAGLATGLLPGTTTVRAVDIQDNNPTAGDFQNRMLTHVRNHPGNVVLNTSLQFHCKTTATAAANCVPANAQLAGSIWLEKVRGTATASVAGSGLEAKFVHAAAAGNVEVTGDIDATTGTPYSAAALIAGMTDADGAAMPNAINTLVVENQLNTPGPYLPACLSRGSKHVLTRTPSTNLVNVSAIGTDVFNLRAPTIAAGNLSGTSMATPQVAALALWVWTLRPNLTNRQVMQIITSSAETAVAPLVEPRCSQVSAPAPSIDVYAAVLATDTSLADAPVRLALLDVVDGNGNDDPDGVFDDRDIARILQEMSAAGGALDFSRYDLNGNGETGGTGGARFDLDFDRIYQTASRQTGTLARTVNERVATDLDILCHYAHTPLFTGDAAKRNDLLSLMCAPPSPEGLTGATLRYTVGAVQQSRNYPAPSMPLTASLDTGGTIDATTAQTSYAITGPIFGPLVDPDNPLVINASARVAASNVTSQVTRTASTTFEFDLDREYASCWIRLDMVCSGAAACNYTALRLIGTSGFTTVISIVEQGGTRQFLWSGSLYAGHYLLEVTADARTASSATSSTEFTLGIRPPQPL
jgi:hypothetical protein